MSNEIFITYFTFFLKLSSSKWMDLNKKVEQVDIAISNLNEGNSKEKFNLNLRLI